MSGFTVPELSRTPTFPECLFFSKCYSFSVLPYSASNFCLNFLISRDLLRVVAFLSPAVLKVMSMESFHCGKAFTHLALTILIWLIKNCCICTQPLLVPGYIAVTPLPSIWFTLRSWIFHHILEADGCFHLSKRPRL